jgi:tRNA (uracil-5-)-methyltransferase
VVLFLKDEGSILSRVLANKNSMSCCVTALKLIFLLFVFTRYISCNPDSLVAKAIELCTPSSEKQEKNKGNRGWRTMSSAGLARQRTNSMPNSEPFVPKRAMAVDLFPHTSHCEMVMLFER